MKYCSPCPTTLRLAGGHKDVSGATTRAEDLQSSYSPLDTPCHMGLDAYRGVFRDPRVFPVQRHDFCTVAVVFGNETAPREPDFANIQKDFFDAGALACTYQSLHVPQQLMSTSHFPLVTITAPFPQDVKSVMLITFPFVEMAELVSGSALTLVGEWHGQADHVKK
jgi:hypothetical protein